MRRTLSLLVLTLALIAAVSRADGAPLIDLLAFCAALALYPFSLALVVLVLLSPFALAWWAWHATRGRRDGHCGVAHRRSSAFTHARAATAGVPDEARAPARTSPEETPTEELPVLTPHSPTVVAGAPRGAPRGAGDTPRADPSAHDERLRAGS